MARKYSRRRTSTTTRYGQPFTTRKGKLGRYKYVNGRRVAFQVLKNLRRSRRKRY